jgi:8-amino-7-oxononanoate synthase
VNLFEKFKAVRDVRAQLQAESTDPTDIIIEEVLSPTEGMIGGRRTILVGTNNYLGLTFDPECIDAGRTALEEQGTGTTGSRMANGSFTGHIALERELAEFYGQPHAVVFSTGYAANLGTLAALLGTGDVALLDADAHASLYDGSRLSGADVYRFAHNDPESLEKRLHRLADRGRRTLVIVEGLYSILGTRARLGEIAALTRRFGAYLLVDEAHSLGVLGPNGRGLAEELDLEDEVDFTVGTFSKSLGATGGFCVSCHDVLELFRYASRPYIFTASPSPSVIATTRIALQILRSRTELRDVLFHNAERLHNHLSRLGFDVGEEISPVIAVRFPGRKTATENWHKLLRSGVYTNLILPPASPDGTALLRASVSAAHTEEQMDHILEAFSRL